MYQSSDKAYGYRRITLGLREDYGILLNRKTVAKIMQRFGLKAKQKNKKSRYSSYQGRVGKVASNLLRQNFKTEVPFTKLVSDITQFSVGSKRVYLSPLIDLYNGEVLSWRIGLRPNADMVLGMLSDAQRRFSIQGAIVHTDQGAQYQAHSWSETLVKYGATMSMSRKGNCLDNAVAESFFGKVKTEFSNGSEYKSVPVFIKKLNEWIIWYNERRIKDSLGGKSPTKYRTMNNPSSLKLV